MSACPPNRTCSRHSTEPPDTPGQTRTPPHESGSQPGHLRPSPDATSRQNTPPRPLFRGHQGDAGAPARGTSADPAAILTDRDQAPAAPHEHPLPPSHARHPRKPRDSVENPDNHRQNTGVESGVTKNTRRTWRMLRALLTPWLATPKPPYAYRTFSIAARDVFTGLATRSPARLLGTSASRSATKTPYTRRAETTGPRCGPFRARLYLSNSVEVP